MKGENTVWAFDLGRASIGDMPSPRRADLNRLGSGERNSPEAKARRAERAGASESTGRKSDAVNTNLHIQFLQKASLLIPADFPETKPAALRQRRWPTRQAHKA